MERLRGRRAPLEDHAMRRLFVTGGLFLALALAGSAAAAQAAAAGSDKGRAELQASFKAATELTQTGKYDEAIAAYNQILATHPSIPEVQYNLGYIYSQKKDWASAEAAYKKALELKPSYSEANIALARVYQDSGQDRKSV